MAIKKGKLSGYDKAAILLLSLGEDVTAKIFSKLDENYITEIGNVMSTLKTVPAELSEQILEEFAAKAEEGGGIISGGEGFLKNALLTAMGEEKGGEMLKSMKAKPGALTEIKRLDAKTVAQFIRHEHPQTIAMIIAHLEPVKAAEALGYFPNDVKNEVIMRIATLDNISPDAIEEVEAVIKRELKSLGGQSVEKVGGINAVAEIVNQMDKASEEAAFEFMDEDDPDLATSIRDLMFVFDDLNDIDDRGIQTILKEVNNEQLMLALKTAMDELKEKIFRNMSERAAEVLKEDMEASGPVKVSDVEAAQKAVVNIARKLEAEGKIVIGGQGGEDVI